MIEICVAFSAYRKERLIDISGPQDNGRWSVDEANPQIDSPQHCGAEKDWGARTLDPPGAADVT